MKKDGIQTRNRKLATKAKKRRPGMHDFFKPFDSRFSAMYSSMGSSYLAAAAATNPMSQYYAGQMSAMQPFMGTPNSSATSVMSPLGQTPLMPTVSTPSLSSTSTSSPSPSMGHVTSTAESAAAVAAAASFSPYVAGNSAAAAATMPVVGASA